MFGKLLETYIANRVKSHSIIALENENVPPETSDDAVLRDSRSRTDGAGSEVAVKDSHSVQDNPAAIREITWILAAAPR
jgi:hypothetical protein